MPLIDVVNFNADASCLWTDKWLHSLQGGRQSVICQMLQNYVRYDRKVNLGLTGVTVRDLAHFNPEAIELIQKHPGVFEIVLRPFAHDHPLLRTPFGFRRNVAKGLEVIRSHFSGVKDCYLAPEVVTTARQIHILKELGVQAIFVHKNRYTAEVAAGIPNFPYRAKGVLGESILCIPFDLEMHEDLFLDVLHGYCEPRRWVTAFEKKSDDPIFFWRDGESSLLIPAGIKLEGRLLQAERAAGIRRAFLSDTSLGEFKESKGHYSQKTRFCYLPYRSLQPWLKDMKLYWLATQIRSIEERLDELSVAAETLWMLTINSDIMSSVEKPSPVIKLGQQGVAVEKTDKSWIGVKRDEHNGTVSLLRSERAAEGEDYLAYLDLLIAGGITEQEMLDRWLESGDPHLLKACARLLPDVSP